MALRLLARSVPHDDAFPKHLQGLAIRIEDEVLVGRDDYILLSANCPREIADVEACCSGAMTRGGG